jgi:hypothetical protein
MEPVFADEINPSVRTGEFLVVPIKANGVFVEQETYTTAIMNEYGFKADDFYDSLNSGFVRDAFLTYAASEPDFDSIMEEYYGPPDNRNRISITSDNYGIGYVPSFRGTGGYNMTINAVNADIGSTNIFMMPLHAFEEITTVKHYDVIKKHFIMIGSSSQTVELEWYQTGFFKFATMVMALAFAPVTGGASLIGLAVGIGLEAIGMIFGEKVAKVVGAIVGVILLYYGGKALLSSAKSTVLDYAAYSLQFSNQFISMYTQQVSSDLAQQRKDYTEQEKAMREQLREESSLFLYTPLDTYSYYYDRIYSIPETVYEYPNQLDAIQTLYEVG